MNRHVVKRWRRGLRMKTKSQVDRDFGLTNPLRVGYASCAFRLGSCDRSIDRPAPRRHIIMSILLFALAVLSLPCLSVQKGGRQ